MSVEVEGKRVRWPWVISCCFAGILLILSAWLLSGAELSSFVAAVLVEIGVAVFLAGLLFLLERRFVRAVSTAATVAATSAATKAATESANEAVRDVSVRLDRLEDQVGAQRTKLAANDDTILRSAAQEASFQNVAEAMSLSLDRGVIARSVTVLAGNEPKNPLIELSLEGVTINDDGQSWPEWIRLNYWGLRKPSGGIGTPIVQVGWKDGTSAVIIVSDLIDVMITAGFGPEAKLVQAGALFHNLHQALRDGVAGRRADDDAWRSAAEIFEILGEDWVITSEGIEERSHGIVLASKAFPELDIRNRAVVAFDPPKPDWVAEAWWTFIVKRGMRYRQRFTFGRLPFGA